MKECSSNLRKTIWKWLMSLMLIVLLWVRHGDVYVESVQVCSCIILMAATLVLQAVIWRLVSFMQFFLVSLLAAIIMQVYRLKRLFIYRG